MKNKLRIGDDVFFRLHLKENHPAKFIYLKGYRVIWSVDDHICLYSDDNRHYVFYLDKKWCRESGCFYIWDYFFTHTEIRKIKLKKLKNACW